MSRKKPKSIALPIVGIVFCGVSLILFAVSILSAFGFFAFSKQPIKADEFVMTQLVEPAFLIAGAVLLILFSARYLKRFQKSKVLICFVLLCAAAYSAYVVLNEALLAKKAMIFSLNFNLFYGLLLCAAALFAVLAAGFAMGGKNVRVLFILAAAFGVLAAAMSTFIGAAKVFQAYSFSQGEKWFGEVFKLVVYPLADLLVYQVGAGFFYTALILSAFFQNKPVPHRVKVTIKRR